VLAIKAKEAVSPVKRIFKIGNIIQLEYSEAFLKKLAASDADISTDQMVL